MRQQGAGLPLGESVLILRPIPAPGDIGIACAVEDPHGRHLASIVPFGRNPSTLGRESENLDFVVVAATGAQRFLITRIGGLVKSHQVTISECAGPELGRLRQISSYWRQFRTPRLSMALESGGRRLGVTDVCIEPEKKRFAEAVSPVQDTAGRQIAAVYRTWQYVDTVTDFFTYRLVCHQVEVNPLPELLLATAFSHYLYDRLTIGGPLSTYNRFGRGGTWHDPR